MGKHFVLVHGACHGAWSWYKLKPLLEAAGHKVTALDLAASGIDSRKIEQVKTLHEYTLPLLELMESVPQDEKVILVGHSLGGLNIGLAMEKFPQKISFGVFLTAFMPSPAHKSSYVLDKFNEQTGEGYWLDTQFLPYGTPEEPRTSMFFGPKFLAKLYHLSSPEDVALASSLVRPSSLFVEDVSKAKYFTEEGYGSVKRVYIKCTEDEAIPLDFQIWLIDNVGVHEAKEVTGADHMPMLCMPIQLCDKLLEVAHACH